MKRLFGLLLLVMLILGGVWLWVQHQAPLPSATVTPVNMDARALSAVEQALFTPLVCGGASAGSDGYEHNCTSLPGYPSDDYGGAGTGLGITLTSVIYGHITESGTIEAYVSYQGSFEPHVNDFGGGILFKQNGQGGWALARWVPGGVMDGCLALNPAGRTKMLCVRGDTGQGETDTVLGIWSPGAADDTKILAASDLRDTQDENANCGLRTSASQAVLLGIDNVARMGAGYVANIEYVPASVAEAACRAHNFANAPVTKAALRLSWDGSKIGLAPGDDFAPSAQP